MAESVPSTSTNSNDGNQESVQHTLCSFKKGGKRTMTIQERDDWVRRIITRKSQLPRDKPNILITGTPGTGKTTISKKVAERLGLEHIDISDFSKKHDAFICYDYTFRCAVLEEQKLKNALEPLILQGGKVVDYHGCELFSSRWFDVLFVMRTNNTILYDRLVERGYPARKLQNNVQAEIFQTLLEEAWNTYDKDVIHEMRNDEEEQIDQNVNAICEWYDKFTAAKAKEEAEIASLGIKWQSKYKYTG